MSIDVEKVKKLNKARTPGEWGAEYSYRGGDRYLFLVISRDKDGVFVSENDGDTEAIAKLPEIMDLCLDLWDENKKLKEELHPFSEMKAYDGLMAIGNELIRRGAELTSLESTLSEKDAEIKRLRDALSTYGEHEYPCPLAQHSGGRPTDDGDYEMCFAGKWYRRGNHPECTCGLDEYLQDQADPVRGDEMDYIHACACDEETQNDR